MNGTKPIVIIDLETGGLDCETDAILEVAAARFAFGKWEYWHRWYLPNGNVCEDAVRVNGLTAEKVKALGADKVFDSDMREFSAWLTGSLPEPPVVVGHNVAFDVGFLKANYSRKGFQFPLDTFRSVDTKSLATLAVLAGKMEHSSLDGACSELGLTLPSHCAMDDVFSARELLNRLGRDFGLWDRSPYESEYA